MADVIKEYAIQIQVQGSKAVIKEFKELEQVEKKQNKQLKETNSLLWTYAKRLVGIYAIYKMFRKGIDLSVSFAEQGNQLRNLASSANISTKSLQKWGQLVKKYGGDEKSVASTMGKLNLDLWMLKNRGVTAPFLEFMKNFKDFPKADNAEDFLIELSKKIKGLSNIEQEAVLSSLSLDPAMKELLKSGNIENKLNNAKVIFTDEQIAKAVKVKNLLIDFNTELQKTMVLLGEKFLPALVKILTEVQNFLNNPKQYAIDTLKKSYHNSVVGKFYDKEIDYVKRFMHGQIGYRNPFISDLNKLANSITSISLPQAREMMGKIAVYNDNAININGTKTPEQVAQAVAGHIIGISNHSLTLAGLGFATGEKYK